MQVNLAPLVTACCQALSNLSVDAHQARDVFAAAMPDAWTTVAHLPYPAAHEAMLQTLYNCCKHDPRRAQQVRPARLFIPSCVCT